jgi:hypothetical protein
VTTNISLFHRNLRLRISFWSNCNFVVKPFHQCKIFLSNLFDASSEMENLMCCVHTRCDNIMKTSREGKKDGVRCRHQ